MTTAIHTVATALSKTVNNSSDVNSPRFLAAVQAHSDEFVALLPEVARAELAECVEVFSRYVGEDGDPRDLVYNEIMTLGFTEKTRESVLAPWDHLVYLTFALRMTGLLAGVSSEHETYVDIMTVFLCVKIREHAAGPARAARATELDSARVAIGAAHTAIDAATAWLDAARTAFDAAAAEYDAYALAHHRRRKKKPHQREKLAALKLAKSRAKQDLLQSEKLLGDAKRALRSLTLPQ